MQPFGYARADGLDEALTAVREPGTMVLAGGTELLNWMRLGVLAPERVVDISRTQGLDMIESLPNGGLRIGTTARLSDVAAYPRIGREWPVLHEAIHKAASPQLRNLATIGGNLLQKTRCAYFRSEQTMPCNRRVAGSGCAALDGRNDRHAIFGWTDACVATQPSDPAVALAALDATVITRGPGGARRIPVRQFHTLPDDRVDADTVLDDGELIQSLELLAPAPRSAYVKVRERESYEYALVSAAVVLDLDGDLIRTVRIALGSVALRPWRLEAAEQELVGLAPGDAGVGEALDRAMAEARPLAENAFKVRLARNAALRALHRAAGIGP